MRRERLGMRSWVKFLMSGALAAGLALGCDDGGGVTPSADMDVGQGGAGGGEGGEGGAGGAGAAGGEGGGEPRPQLESRHPRVRFKRADRLRLEFARAMDLALNRLCTELSFTDCFAVHGVSLGGVEAYDANIYEPFENTSIAAPMVVERIATFACTQRIFLDVSDRDSSVIWGDVPLDGARLRDVEGEEATAAITTLFTRSLQRRPTAAELSGAQALYREIEATDVDQPALYWAQGLCVAVLTSAESLFY